jgi:hypothetical protein
MTKKNKGYNWRRVFKLSVSFLGLAIIFSACKKEVSTVGNSINPNGLNIITSDTFTVKTYSVELDSIATDETSISLLGAVKDPELGLTDCGIVTQIRLSSTSPNFGDVNQLTVDSVVLALKYDSRLNYGTLQNLNFEVYEITDQLNIDDDYYASTPVNTNGVNLVKTGTSNKFPDVFADAIVGQDTLAPQLRLQLDPTFGDYLIANSSEMTSNDNFTTFFKGLYIKVTDASTLNPEEGTVLYFSLEDALSNMTLYYTSGTENKTFTFNINNKCARYNKIDVDRTGTDAELVLNNTDLGQEKFYLQGTLIRPEIEFPYIMDLQKNGKVVLNYVALIVPVQDFTNDPFQPSEELFFGEVIDKYITGFIKDYPYFTTVSYDSNNKEFKFLMTQELQAVLDGDKEPGKYRMFPSNFFGSTIERTIFNGAEANLKEKTRLEITYTTY